MNKFLLLLLSLLPEPQRVGLIRLFIDAKIKKHVKLEVRGLENLKTKLSGPYLFICNHLSNADALLLDRALALERITFVAGRKLATTALTNLGLKLVKSIPISPSSADRDAIEKIIGTVKGGGSVLLFPEGTRSRTARMQEGKKGILLFAKRTGVPIVPIGLWGTEKFLPVGEDMSQESFHDAEVGIAVGEAFYLPPKEAVETKADWEIRALDRVMRSVAALLPPAYRGVYG